MKKVIVIVGPTGTGKTELSIRLAKEIGAEIINGDSVQVYQGLDIGSAKIKESEKQGITHHLLDVVREINTYSVYNFQKDARALIEKIEIPMIVGGTGLYIKAAVYDYEFKETKSDSSFEIRHQEQTNGELYQQLIKLDPNIEIDQKNRRRLLRALEQAQKGDLRSLKTKKDVLLYDALIIYLDIDKNTLEKRLISRLDQQIKDGFIKEVKNISQPVNAIGYRQIASHLAGECSLEEARLEIVKASKRLAKKQKTWFKNQMNPLILDALSDTLYQDALTQIKLFLGKESVID